MKANLSLFIRPLFLLGLVVLISNDFYFKYAFPGVLTGKLSDFAGLFIFPYFFSVFFEKRIKTVYVATALYFTFWKLEISQPYIDWLSSLTHLPFYRTVDVTDLIALLILPLSYQYFRKELPLSVKVKPAIQMTIFLISAFSFVATKTKIEEVNFEFNKESGKRFLVPVHIDELVEEYKYYKKDFSNAGFPLIGYNAYVYAAVELKKLDDKNTIVILKKINSYDAEADLYEEPYDTNTEGTNQLTLEIFEESFKLDLIEKYGYATPYSPDNLNQTQK